MDASIFGLSGALVEAPFPGAEAFSTTPLLDLLRDGAAHDPAAIALVSRTARISYGDLLRLVRHAAFAVSELVPIGQSVACLLPRSPEAMAGLIGCLLSGRLCMVLDPAHPPERQAAVLADAKPSALMLTEPLPFRFDAPVLMLSDVLAAPEREWQPEHEWNPDAPLAVYFTSGSSGRPKGIVLSARSVLFRAVEATQRWKLVPGDRVFAPDVHATGSGLSILLGALAGGARLLLTDIAREGAGAVLRLVEREAVTCAVIHPPVMRLLSQLERARRAFCTLRTLRMGATALPRTDLAAWRSMLPPDCVIWHNYASTEALFVSAWIVADDGGTEITVAAGMIQPSHDYAVLGEGDCPVESGEPGELVLRSQYVALGEWQEGQLTPGRMPPVPDRPGWRFYRTGDLVRLQANGMLRVVGRADRQVKINGIRVEPAEIEAILRSEPGVTEAAVVATTVAGSVTLHGFAAAKDRDHTDLVTMLRRRLSAALPMPLRPTSLTVLDRLPMLPSGKVDMLALSRQTQHDAGAVDR